MTSTTKGDEELVHDMAIQNIKCPYCDGEVNKKWFWDIIANHAFFICECWSGDVYKDMPRHIFKVGVELVAETVFIKKPEENQYIAK